MEKQVLLYNVRSAHNVGSVFRTADGAGASKIYCAGTTPTPVDRFGRVQPAILKTSLGATENIPWEHVGNANSESLKETLALIHSLQAAGWQVVAIELAPKAISFYDFSVPQRVVYIFGHEVEGVPAEILAAVDQIVEIPMAGKKESLNVSVTAGIVLFKI